MEKKVNKSGVLRKRGRPAGKNRVPLSQNERRARNAQYERERRVEMTDALADLAAAAGCSSSIANADLLATVLTQLQQASSVKHASDVESLRRCNRNLLAQIETLEAQLAGPDEATDSCSVPPLEHEEVTTLLLPEYKSSAHDECMYLYSPEQEESETSPSPVGFPDQHLIPENNYSPESILDDQEHIVGPDLTCSPEQPAASSQHSLPFQISHQSPTPPTIQPAVMGIASMLGASHFNEAEQDSNIHLLSTDDLIAIYL